MISLASRLDVNGLEKSTILCSIDLYEDLACCGYKRECQDLAKILQLLICVGSFMRA